jgi:soluble lytic murein transglycosylase-like protein
MVLSVRQMNILMRKIEIAVFLALTAGSCASGQTSSVDGQLASALRQRERAATAMAASAQKQTSALRVQSIGLKSAAATSENSFFVTAPLTPPAPVEVAAVACDALPPAKVQDLVAEAASEERVSPVLLREVMRRESAFNPCAISPKGAMGLMQLMPGTADSLGLADAMDPEQNVLGGARLLHSLLNRYAGDLSLTLGAYNAGPTRVDEAGGIPPIRETTDYVDTILKSLGASPER